MRKIQHIAESILLDSASSIAHDVAGPGGIRGHYRRSSVTNDIGNKKQEAPGARLTRRAALAAAATLPLSVDPVSANDAVAMLVARAAAKNAAFMRGDMARWLELVRLAPDFTLMQPFGGPASHGFDTSPARMAQRARYFQNGKTAIDLAQSYATPDMIVLVMIERQTAEVGGLPEQDWSLRVTEVYRLEETEWVLAHRHADPLVRPISLNQAARIAQGL
jgi:hypothetical protein